jgi:guanylate kinase
MSKKVLGNLSKGLLFVISAPAGTGKSTLVEMLLKEFPESIEESCSCTTRHPRPNEIAKTHYEFLLESEFQKKIQNGELLEYAQVFGHHYGTRRDVVEKLQESGKHVILVIDTQGAAQIRNKIEATFIFISPPSMDELRNRLFKRRTENEEKIAQRLEWAKHELEMIPSYDYHIVNDNLEVTYQILRSIIIAAEHKKGEK